MARIDLTPKGYQSSRQTRKAKVLWSILVGLCTLVAAVPMVFESSRMPNAAVAVAGERLVQAERRAAQAEQQRVVLHEQLAVEQRAMRAGQHLTLRPDWSSLLRVVAGQFGGRVLLTGVLLSTSDDPVIRAELKILGQDDPAESPWMLLEGLAESSQDVTALVLRMEKLGLFKQVVLSGTQRESYSGEHRTAFVLVCRLD